VLRMDREQNGNCSSQKSSFRKFQQISNDNALVVIKENNSRLVDNPSLTGTFEALWVYLRYGPVTRSPSLLDGFVNRLQDSQSPSFLLFKLRGLNSYPDGTFTHCSCQPSLDAHFPLLIQPR